MPQPRTIPATGVISRDRLMERFAERFAPEKFEVPDYGTEVAVQMLSAGDQEHCNAFARMPDGSQNTERWIRIWVAYGLA
jgi:hypothetical protein